MLSSVTEETDTGRCGGDLKHELLVDVAICRICSPKLDTTTYVGHEADQTTTLHAKIKTSCCQAQQRNPRTSTEVCRFRCLEFKDTISNGLSLDKSTTPGETRSGMLSGNSCSPEQKAVSLEENIAATGSAFKTSLCVSAENSYRKRINSDHEVLPASWSPTNGWCIEVTLADIIAHLKLLERLKDVNAVRCIHSNKQDKNGLSFEVNDGILTLIVLCKGPIEMPLLLHWDVTEFMNGQPMEGERPAGGISEMIKQDTISTHDNGQSVEHISTMIVNLQTISNRRLDTVHHLEIGDLSIVSTKKLVALRNNNQTTIVPSVPDEEAMNLVAIRLSAIGDEVNRKYTSTERMLARCFAILIQLLVSPWSRQIPV